MWHFKCEDCCYCSPSISMSCLIIISTAFHLTVKHCTQCRSSNEIYPLETLECPIVFITINMLAMVKGSPRNLRAHVASTLGHLLQWCVLTVPDMQYWLDKLTSHLKNWFRSGFLGPQNAVSHRGEKKSLVIHRFPSLPTETDFFSWDARRTTEITPRICLAFACTDLSWLLISSSESLTE